MDHLLICECGNEIPVSRSQAGQELPCECGRTVKVPTLRGLSALPTVENSVKSSTVDSTGSKWAGWRGSLFALAICTILVSGIFTGTCLYYRWTINTDYTTEDFIAEGDRFYDSLNPVELSLSWNDFQKFNIGQKMPPAFFIMGKHADRLDRWSMIGGSICLIGAVIAGGIWATLPRRRA
ncbi:MAG: hypothetical protein R3C53_05330 [Pirellulaceae bacterium]